MRKVVKDQRKGMVISQKVWVNAHAKLRGAKCEILKMQSAKSNIEFESAWAGFVNNIQEFWVKFDHEGQDNFKSFAWWVGKYNKARSEDPLLIYIFQARNKSQHPKEEGSLKWLPERVEFGTNFNGWIKSLEEVNEKGRPMIYVDYTPQNQGIYDDPNLVIKDPEAQLQEFKNRGIVYAPPNLHRCKVLEDISPIAVAQKALSFYEEVFEEAKENFLKHEV